MKNTEQTSHFRTMTEYNGYTNKPTWLVSLWIDNDQNDLETVIEVAKDILNTNDNNIHESAYDLAQWLDDRHEEWKHETVRMNNVFSDLMNFAFAYVNWDELAKMYIEQAKEELESEEE